MNNIKAFFAKRVAGIPVLYIVGVAVGIFAWFAFRMKPSVQDVTTDEGSDGASGTGDAGAAQNGDLAGSVYDQLKTSGTVVVAPAPTDDTSPSTTVKTNETWLSDGVQWLVKEDKATGTIAQAALSKYLEGQNYSFDEGKLIDAWYKQGGPPPDGISSPGKVGTQPAQKQGNPPLDHVVKGSNDDTYGKIATLYYGHNEQQTYDLVQAANVNRLGPVNGPYTPGTKITVPVYRTQKIYTLPRDMDSSQISAANGISRAQFEALNNTTQRQWKKGNKVRVA